MTTNECYYCRSSLADDVRVYCQPCWDLFIEPELEVPITYEQAVEDWRETRAIEELLNTEKSNG